MSGCQNVFVSEYLCVYVCVWVCVCVCVCVNVWVSLSVPVFVGVCVVVVVVVVCVSVTDSVLCVLQSYRRKFLFIYQGTPGNGRRGPPCTPPVTPLHTSDFSILSHRQEAKSAIDNRGRWTKARLQGGWSFGGKGHKYKAKKTRGQNIKNKLFIRISGRWNLIFY